MGGTDPVESDGTAPVWINDNASTASLAATSDGYATAYAGPFEPPTREKLDGVRFRWSGVSGPPLKPWTTRANPLPGQSSRPTTPARRKMDLGAAATDASGRAVFDHIGAAPLTVLGQRGRLRVRHGRRHPPRPGQTLPLDVKKSVAAAGNGD